MTSNHESKDNNDNKFDFNSAINLFPNLINLINLSSIQSISNNNNSNSSNQILEDIEIRNSKLEIGRNATILRQTLTNLKLQSNNFKFGNLSLKEQEIKILELKKELNLKNQELNNLISLFPTLNESTKVQIEPSSTAMETD